MLVEFVVPQALTSTEASTGSPEDPSPASIIRNVKRTALDPRTPGAKDAEPCCGRSMYGTSEEIFMSYTCMVASAAAGETAVPGVTSALAARMRRRVIMV